MFIRQKNIRSSMVIERDDLRPILQFLLYRRFTQGLSSASYIPCIVNRLCYNENLLRTYKVFIRRTEIVAKVVVTTVAILGVPKII